MRNQLLAATALSGSIAFLVPGLAAAAPVHSWSGFYFGLGAGVVSSQSTVDFSGLASDVVPSRVDLPALGQDGSVRFGYNWQAGQFVYGLEENLDVVSLHGSLTGNAGTQTYFIQDSLNTLLSLRARFGVAFDRMMLFTTAGVATGNASFRSDVGKNAVPATANGVVVGGVAGLGIEYAVNDNVSLTATSTYYSLSSLHAVGDAGKAPVPGSSPYTATYSPHGAVFEAGVNVHF